MFMDTPIVIELPYTPMWNRDVAKGDAVLEYYRLPYFSLLVIEFEYRARSSAEKSVSRERDCE